MKMPKFDPMRLVTDNRSVLGFNLSFFVEEIDLLGAFWDRINDWLERGDLSCPRIVEMDMDEIGAAHDLIQSGKSVGKIVVNTGSRPRGPAAQ